MSGDNVNAQAMSMGADGHANARSAGSLLRLNVGGVDETAEFVQSL